MILLLNRIFSSFKKKTNVFLFFCFSSFLLFTPFFLQHRPLVAETDLYFAHYPNILFGFRTLKAGFLPLWNPYIFTGFDFTSTMHNHMLDPYNWILLLFKEKYIFSILTIRAYLEIVLIGFLTFTIFNLFHKNHLIPIFLGIVMQLGEFTWFTLTTFIATHLAVFTMIIIYIILTLEKRSNILNFSILSLCIFEIFMVGHIGYISAFGILIIITFFIKFWGNFLSKEHLPQEGLVIFAGITGFTMALWRIWPVLHGFLYEQTMFHNMVWPESIPHNSFFLSGFIPQSLGISLGESQRIAHLLDMGPKNAQFHNLLYFGIISIFLTIVSLIGILGKRSLIVSFLFIGVATTHLFLNQPFSDMVQFAIYPFIHDIILRVLTPFLLLILLSLSLKNTEDKFILHMNNTPFIIFAIMTSMVLGLFIAMWVRIFHSYTLLKPDDFMINKYWHISFLISQTFLILIFVFTSIFISKLKLSTEYTKNVTDIAIKIAFSLMFILGALMLNRGVFTWTYVLNGYIYAIGKMLWLLGSIILIRYYDKPTKYKITVYSLFLSSLFILIYPLPDSLGTLDQKQAPLLDGIISILPFIVLSAIVIETFIRYRESSLRKDYFIPFLILLTFGDVLFTTKVYEYVGGIAPFVDRHMIYPKLAIPGSKDDYLGWSRSLSLPNITLNPNFDINRKNPVNWHIGGSKEDIERVSSISRTIEISNPDPTEESTLYQDRTFKNPSKDLTFGLWIKTKFKNKIYLLIVGNDGDYVEKKSLNHTGSGKWEWLSTSIHSDNGFKWSRIHIVVKGKANALVFSPVWIKGSYAVPKIKPDGDSYSTKNLKLDEMGPEYLDFKQYRVNHPDFATKLFNNDIQSNIPMLYGLRLYGGVDSDIKERLIDLITNFENNPGVTRGGILGDLKNQRLLDILGVKYDFNNAGSYKIRPNALARFSLFYHYKIENNQNAMLSALKDGSFNSTTTVLLNQDTNWAVKNGKYQNRFTPILYREISPDEVKLAFTSTKPAILLFNDSYSPYWEAKVNGRLQPVLLANGNFMAINILPGKNVVDFEFSPRYLLPLFAIFVVLFAIILCVTLIVGFKKIYERRRHKAMGLIHTYPE